VATIGIFLYKNTHTTRTTMKKTPIKAPLNPLEAEIAVTALHASGNFQVLRKINLEQDTRLTRRTVASSRIGLCLDTETTGLDHARDKVIELGIVAFEYDPATATIIRVSGCYSGFEDPGFPLSDETTEITGITDDMVRGQVFDEEQVNRLADQATLVIAHNAGFDRKFVESRFPAFSRIPWACTVNQINWQAERISTRVLEYLLFKFGWFIHAHRALNDAEGVLGILLENLPVSKTPVFRAVLDTYDEVTSKICAVGAPFDKKDLLKSRGYRWSDGTQGSCKAWWISVPGDLENDELAWLASEVYPRGIPDGVEISRVTAIDRFSIRER
jgi:DNA polymerase-3 subunit epsilon